MPVRGRRGPQSFAKAIHTDNGQEHPRGVSRDPCACGEVLWPSMEFIDQTAWRLHGYSLERDLI